MNDEKTFLVSLRSPSSTEEGLTQKIANMGADNLGVYDTVYVYKLHAVYKTQITMQQVES